MQSLYARLARSEEREIAGLFGDEWTAYAAHTPAFIPSVLRHPAGVMMRRHRRAGP